MLLAQALAVRRLDLYLQFDRPLADHELAPYRSLIARRAKGEPVAYLVGHKEFMALDFEVTPAVLVPQPDTEVLVQLAVAWVRERGGPLRVADVGTGSGCIAVSLAHYVKELDVWAGDDSADALDVARRNASKHGVDGRIHFGHGDLLEALPGTFDLVCANLPYVAAAAKLPAEVTAQPAHALFGGAGGADVVVRLLEAAPSRLNVNGRVLVEIDPLIVDEVVTIAQARYGGHRIHRDLGNHERVLEAWIP